MLTNKDVQKLKKALATKKDLEKFSEKAFKTFATKKDLEKFSKKAFETFATKKDLEEKTTKLFQEILVNRKEIEVFKKEVERKFDDLHTAINAYAKKADTYFQEMVMLSHKVERHEKWIRQIAEKLGMKLEY